MTSGISNLTKWFFENKFIVKRGQDRKLTHLLMNGGKVSIPENKYSEFLHIFASDIREVKLGNLGYLNFISENRTPIFKFLVDIDYIDEFELKEKQIQNFVINVQKALTPFLKYDLNTYERKTIICTTGEIKKIINNDLELIKTGIHMIWPNIYVDEQYAKFLRSIIIQYFLKFFPKRPSYNTWENVFDYAVYSSSGLRMKGSAKMVKCTKCKAKKNKVSECMKCYGKGKLIEGSGRIYMPRLIIDGKGNELKDEFMKINKNKYEMLKQTCLRIYGKKKNFKMIKKEDYPEWFDTEILLTHLQKPKIKRKKKAPKTQLDKILKTTQKGLKVREKLDREDIRFISIEKFMNNLYYQHEHYKNQKIFQIYKCGKGKKNEFYTILTDTKYCQNVKRCHNGNHLWFVINNVSIFQKCFSESYNDKSICCNEFHSELQAITFTLRNILYPEMLEKQKKNFRLNKGIEIDLNNIDFNNDDNDDQEIKDVSIKSFPSLKLQMGIKERLKFLENKFLN